MAYDSSQDYGVRNPDGSVTVYNPTYTDENGVYQPVRTESWEQNQGLPSARATLGSSTQAGGYGQYNDYGQRLDSADQRAYLRDRLNKLEIPASLAERIMAAIGMSGYYKPTAPMTDDQALDYIWNNWPDLKNLAKTNGYDIKTPEQARAFLRTDWLPGNAGGKTFQEVAKELGAASGAWNAASAGEEGALPTFEREKWNAQTGQWEKEFGEGQRRFNTATGQWEKTFGEEQRRFNTQTGQWERGFERAGEQWNRQFGEGQRQFDIGLLASKSGATNQAVYEAMLRNAGTTGQVAAIPSWEQGLVSAWTGGAAPAARFRQPNQISAQEMAQWDPTQRQREASRWSYAGLDPNDMWARAQKAQPQWQSAGQSYFRG